MSKFLNREDGGRKFVGRKMMAIDTMTSCRISLCATLCLAFWCNLSADEFKIKMNGAALTDPILEWQTPVADSQLPVVGSELQMQEDGILVQQFSKDGKKSNPSIGFRVLVPTSGDFTIQLSLDCLELEQPKDGWGQGIVLKANVADAKKTVVTIGWVTRPEKKTKRTGEASAFVAYETKPPAKPKYLWEPAHFRTGSMTISREKNMATFSMMNQATEVFRETMPIPTDDISSFEVWCTRQDEPYNTNARYLLKELKLIGTSHNGLRPIGNSWSLRLVFNTFVTCLVLICLFLWYRQRTIGTS